MTSKVPKPRAMPRNEKLPDHWRMVRLKDVVTWNDEVLAEDTPVDREIDYVEISDVTFEDGVTSSNRLSFASAPSRARRLVRVGDILVSTVRTYLRAIAHVQHASPDMIASTGFAVLRSRKDDARYISYAVRAERFVGSVISKSTGVSYPAIKASDLVRISISISSDVAEQARIAGFLDRETSKIDRLIKAQLSLLSLLREKREVLISEVVRNGLDANVSMKPSGTKWLGSIPQHWQILPLKELTPPERAIMYGIVLPGPDVGIGVPIVKGGDVRPHRLRLNSLCRTTLEIELPFARARLKADDIVYSIRGSIGDAELVPDDLVDANITQDVARISPKSGVDPRWLLYVMKSKPIFAQLERRSLGAAVRGINIYDLKRCRVPVPPFQEQQALALYLSEQLSRFAELEREVATGMALLRERRAAIISAAVSGTLEIASQGSPCGTALPAEAA